MKFILNFISKENLIVYTLSLFLHLLQKKPNGKFAQVITSDKMRNTMRDISNHYASFCEAWDAEQAEKRFDEEQEETTPSM